MKKTIGLLSVALLPTIAFDASAASDKFAGAATVTTETCTMFSENLKLNPSANVVGGWNCDTAGIFETSKGAQFVIATCHTAGRQGSRPATTTDSAGATGATTATGSLIFRAGTGGGSMSQKFPGSACDSAGAQALSAATTF